MMRKRTDVKKGSIYNTCISPLTLDEAMGELANSLKMFGDYNLSDTPEEHLPTPELLERFNLLSPADATVLCNAILVAKKPRAAKHHRETLVIILLDGYDQLDQIIDTTLTALV